MPASRRRTATKLLRLHPDELARITARAEACGVNPARFIRETALGAVRKARHHADTDRLLRALARLGWRLERAMRHVRSTGDAKLAELFAEIRNDHRALLAELLALRAPDHSAITQPRRPPPCFGRGVASPSRTVRRSSLRCRGSGLQPPGKRGRSGASCVGERSLANPRPSRGERLLCRALTSPGEGW